MATRKPATRAARPAAKPAKPAKAAKAAKPAKTSAAPKARKAPKVTQAPKSPKAAAGKASRPAVKPGAKTARPAPRRSAAPPAARRREDAAPAKPKPEKGGIAGKLLSWSDNLIGLAAPLTGASLALTRVGWKSPAKSAAVKGAALLLAQTRKSLGLTVGEVAKAIDLKNPELLDHAETGKAALPFEIILRLAAVLGRNDPLSFTLRLTRAYNPGLWEKMEAIGVGRLVEHMGREREFVNIYRGSDAARRLTDDEFAAVLKLVAAAFELALVFKRGD